MKWKLSLAICVALILGLTALSLKAQQTQASQKSYQQARRVLNDAIEAHGGLEALRSIRDFTLKEKGKVYGRYQSPRPEEFSAGPGEGVERRL